MEPWWPLRHFSHSNILLIFIKIKNVSADCTSAFYVHERLQTSASRLYRKTCHQAIIHLLIPREEYVKIFGKEPDQAKLHPGRMPTGRLTNAEGLRLAEFRFRRWTVADILFKDEQKLLIAAKNDLLNIMPDDLSVKKPLN